MICFSWNETIFKVFTGVVQARSIQIGKPVPLEAAELFLAASFKLCEDVKFNCSFD